MTHNEPRSRRAYLKATGAMGTAVLVGTTGRLGRAEASVQEDGSDFNELEIVHWWTAGG